MTTAETIQLVAIIEHIDPWVKFITAAISLVVTLSGAIGAFVLWLRKWGKRTRQEIVQAATTAGIQAAVKQHLEALAEKEDPNNYFTLDVHFDGGLCLAVPMFKGSGALVAENMVMRVARHGKDYTALDLQCHGFGHLPKHHHASTCETIEVKEGIVTHLETGRIYRAGETWVIPAGEVHSATFQDCWCIVTHRPALPTAHERPMNLDAMERVFPKFKTSPAA